MMKQIEFPVHVDDPRIMIMWTADEFLIFTAILCVGVLVDHTWFAMMIGAVSTRIVRRIREGMPEGFLLHILWWKGLLKLKGKTFPNPFQREYIP
ncbi:MAG: type IV conjugative transfer system protein TraL [Methylococcales bacterium]|nr:type IV conjugative transfer system protein TraL [Methylococcales bacterium]